jgi:hypothetical protein
VELEGAQAIDDRLDVFSERRELAAGWCDQAVQQLQQGGLAAPIRAQQDDLVAAPNVQVDSVEREVPTVVVVAHPPQLKDQIVLRCQAIHPRILSAVKAPTPIATAPTSQSQSRAVIR